MPNDEPDEGRRAIAERRRRRGERAARIAAETVGGGRVRSIELERKSGRAVYEVKVGRAEVYVDAATGKALARHEDEEDD